MNNLDRPLGDIIKANKKAKKPAPKKNTKKAAPAKKSSKKQTQQPSGAVRNQRPRARTAPYTPKQTLGGGLTAGAKVMVTNLDPTIAQEDVAEILGNCGPVKGAVVHYDRDGRSLGTAEVTFARKQDAMKAVSEYDGAEVDGRPMYLKVIATKAPTVVVQPRAQPVQQPRRPVGRGGAVRGAPQQRPKSAARGGRGGARGGRGGGRGGRAKREGKKPVSAADLDAEMDNYFSGDKSSAATATPGAAGQPSAAETATES